MGTFSLIAHTNIEIMNCIFIWSSFFVHTLLVLFILCLSEHNFSNLFMPDVFLSLCLALMVASLLETIFITNLLCCTANVSPVPHWIKVFVLQILGCLVFLPQKTKEQRDAGTAIETYTVVKYKVYFLLIKRTHCAQPVLLKGAG